MIYLIAVSLIWAFSFGLIKGNLAGVDTNFSAAARLVIALVMFLPALRPRQVNFRTSFHLMVLGAVQYGLMYLSYFYAFRYLQAYEVALFTIFTPLYVTLINDLLQARMQFRNLFTALLTVVGTGIIVFQSISDRNLLLGFLIVQLSNICFAAGQLGYRQVMKTLPDVADKQVFAWLYAGAVVPAAIAAFFSTGGQWPQLTTIHHWTLLYLGVLASGLCFFWWNIGARRVSAGTLAILNNLKIPAAVTVSIFFFGEGGDLQKLLIGGLLILVALFWDRLAQKEAR